MSFLAVTTSIVMSLTSPDGDSLFNKAATLLPGQPETTGNALTSITYRVNISLTGGCKIQTRAVRTGPNYRVERTATNEYRVSYAFSAVREIKEQTLECGTEQYVLINSFVVKETLASGDTFRAPYTLGDKTFIFEVTIQEPDVTQ